ncbi:hypothetical protein ISN44_As07g016610 [Arabidopsis suecica]|uniref:Uncharacterized protein n=1 Tax=Arabidopsis suecica TaxID=45249 RepID=A0A8T2BTR1_ARASU|nr:hypothetical protein ISN44_As07g016610 [Arabidopsis suecica]
MNASRLRLRLKTMRSKHNSIIAASLLKLIILERASAWQLNRKKRDGLRFYRTKFSYILYVMWMAHWSDWDANAKLKRSHKTLICNMQTCLYSLEHGIPLIANCCLTLFDNPLVDSSHEPKLQKEAKNQVRNRFVERNGRFELLVFES